MADNIREHVEDRKRSLAEDSDSEEISDILGHSRLAGTRIGLGLLYLNEISEAQQWFDAVSEKWMFYVEYYNEKKLEADDTPRLGELKWLELLRGVQTAVLSGDSDTIGDATRVAIEESTNPRLEELPGAEANPRVSAIAALASLISGNDPSDHLARLSSRLENVDRPHDTTLYSTVATIIDGLHTQDAEAVTQGIEELEAYHEEFTVGSDISHFTEEAVNIDACTFIVLARRMGMDVRVESEYVPEGVYDDAYYPIGG